MGVKWALAGLLEGGTDQFDDENAVRTALEPEGDVLDMINEAATGVTDVAMGAASLRYRDVRDHPEWKDFELAACKI